MKTNKMITALLLLSILFTNLFLFKSQASAENIVINSSDIDKFVTSKMNDLRIPGISIGVVQGDQITYTKGYGDADSKGTPVTPQTPFILGSTTKSITALAIMQLVEKGKIQLDEPVQKYIPWFTLSDQNVSKTITVRNLLNQTSGISGTAGGSDYRNSKSTSEEFIKRLTTQKIVGKVGTDYQYSEANYVILGEIISKVSGQTYQEYIKNNIFEPLDMRHSFTSKNEAISAGLATGYRTCFGFPFAANFPYPVQYTSSSYLISSAEDMAHYLKLYVNSGRYNDISILSETGTQQLFHPGVALQHPVGYSYAMGWFVNDEYQMHDGRPTNYYSCMVITPKNKTGVVVLTNANNRLVTAEYSMSIAYGISDILSGKKVEIASSGFRQLYLIFNLIVIFVIIAILLRFFLSITQLRKKLKNYGPLTLLRVLSTIIPDLLLLITFVGALLYLLSMYGISLSIAMLGQPDIIITFIVAISLAAANLITRLTIVYLQTSSRKVHL